MRNYHEVQGWKLTPAESRTTYGNDKSQTITVRKLESGKSADGYHVESPKGACFFVSRWDTDNTWTSQELKGREASAEASCRLDHSSPTLKLLLERLRNSTRVRDLESQLGYR